MNYCIVVLPSKCPPLSMTNVVAQFILTVSEESVSGILHLLGFRLLGLFWCKVVAFYCKDLTTFYHNLISGKGFIKPIKYKSNRDILADNVSAVVDLISLQVFGNKCKLTVAFLCLDLQANQTKI